MIFGARHFHSAGGMRVYSIFQQRRIAIARANPSATPLRSRAARRGSCRSQIQKLELAGRGDITRLFGLIDEHRRKLKAARQGANDVFLDNSLDRQTTAVRSTLRSGPFDEDSLLGRVWSIPNGNGYRGFPSVQFLNTTFRLRCVEFTEGMVTVAKD
jgi:hypothetical protein